MAGIPKGNRDSFRHRHRAPISQRHELPHRFLRIDRTIERLDGRQTLFSPSLGNEYSVVLLNLCGILEHDRRKITSGEGGVDVSRKSVPDKVRQVAAVIDVRVAEQDTIKLRRIEGELAIAFDGLIPMTLKQSALQKNSTLIDLQQIHRACGRARGTVKVDSHERSVPSAFRIATDLCSTTGHAASHRPFRKHREH